MGRRKQANPSRRLDKEDTLIISQPSTSAQPSPNPSPSTSSTSSSKASPTSENGIKLKKYSDFSITTTLKKPNKPNDDLASAQKAYQALLNGLDQKKDGGNSNPLMNLYKQVEKLASNAHNSNGSIKVVDGKSSNGAVTNGTMNGGSKRASSRAPLMLEETSNGDSALDLSLKKPKTDEGNALEKLSSLVTTVGAKPSTFFNFAEPKATQEDNDPSKIFTCLQCFERFQSMDQLVKHMEKTLHFNQFKQTNGKTDSHRDPKINNNRYSMFSYKCVICGHSSNSSIEEHMTKFHNFKSHNEWIHAVKLVPL